jgi:ketosteroid isomerase-like protein
MRNCLTFVCIALLACFAVSQQAATPPKPVEHQQTVIGDSALKDLFQSKIKAEWEAIKNKDKKAYADLLADDYQGVEVDGRGERNRMEAIRELAETNVYNYTLWGLKVIPVGTDAAFVIYEVTMQFPPKSQVRYSRVYIGELWVKTGDQWKLLHYQETHVK